MFVFGGRGENGALMKDMYLLDLNEWCWVKVTPTTAAPNPRFDHADVLVGNKIAVFGGWDGKKCFNDLWVFDTEAFTWMKPKTAGSAPSPRHSVKMQLLEDGRIVVFGGHSTANMQENLKQTYQNDVRSLDTETMIWSKPRVLGDNPSGRMGHTMCQVGNTLALVGGWAGVRRSMVFEYLPVPDNFEERDISMLNGFQHFLDLGNSKMEWVAPAVTGVDHPHRYGHSCNLVGDYLFVFGGWDGNRPMNDLQVCDVSQFTSRGGK
jgi:N-acetylneuraminic acid mutarotase